MGSEREREKEHLFAPDTDSINVCRWIVLLEEKRCQDMKFVFYKDCVWVCLCVSQNKEHGGKVDFAAWLSEEACVMHVVESDRFSP